MCDVLSSVALEEIDDKQFRLLSIRFSTRSAEALVPGFDPSFGTSSGSSGTMRLSNVPATQPVFSLCCASVEHTFFARCMLEHDGNASGWCDDAVDGSTSCAALQTGEADLPAYLPIMRTIFCLFSVLL